MTYTCIDCGFLFSRVGAVERCPSCEGNRIRPATEEESETFRRLVNSTSTAQRERKPH